jgi:hypothetical protein
MGCCRYSRRSFVSLVHSKCRAKKKKNSREDKFVPEFVGEPGLKVCECPALARSNGLQRGLELWDRVLVGDRF